MKLRFFNQYLISDFTDDDKSALVEHLKEKEIYERTLRIPYPYTFKDAEDWIHRARAQEKMLGKSVDWAIRDSDGLLIGGIGFNDYENGKTTSEMGYWLAKPYWGKGIVPEAVKAVCQYAFKNLHLTMITAHAADFNERSCRVLEKAGFTFDRIQKDHYVKENRKITAKGYFIKKP